MRNAVVMRGEANVRENGLRLFLWPTRWLVLREETLSMYVSIDTDSAARVAMSSDCCLSQILCACRGYPLITQVTH